MPTTPWTYTAAGVDIAAADSATSRIRDLAQRTFDSNVLSGIGAFGAAYSLAGRNLRDPVLVSSADGVGTKLKIAFAANRHDTVGQCLVNHCVNDIAVQGATPLFFLDYLSMGRLDSDVAEQVVGGISQACQENSVALIGGETAEMPDMYSDGEYDLAGFIVGAVERNGLLLGNRVESGSALLGLPSNGLHTNGYSLARKLLLESAGYSLDQRIDGFEGTVADEMLKVHRSYLKALQALSAEGVLQAAAHITGGGISGNVPRMLPKGLEARIYPILWKVPEVFQILQGLGSIEKVEMYRTFNMGIGMVVSVAELMIGRAIAALSSVGIQALPIGHVAEGSRGVVYLE